MKDLSTRFNQVINVILPKKLPNAAIANTPTFSEGQRNQALVGLTKDSHTQDILDYRMATDDSTIIKELAKTDSDVSATVSAYLSIANTEMSFICRDETRSIDKDAQQRVSEILNNLTSTINYGEGFTLDKSLNRRNAAFRYHILVSGACAGELIQDKKLGQGNITDFLIVDPDSLEWYERDKGRLTPMQKSESGDDIDLDIVTFFYSAHQQDPNKAYPVSPFVSVINSIYARRRIIEDLYRIMSINGYPRVRIKVLEQVIMEHAPAEIKKTTDMAKKQNYLRGYMTTITNAFQNVRADQPLVHTDSYEVDVLNNKGSMSVDITPIISILNSQNQTALKVVGTILGRGESGVNTASVETRVFLKSVEDFNKTLASLWSQALTFALRLTGSSSVVEVSFAKPSFNTEVEDAPNKVINQSILLKDLSLGIITDDEYCLKMYGRLKLDSAPELSGTRFLDSNGLSEVTETPSDPRNQPDSYSKAGDGGKSQKSAKDNSVK